MTDQTPLTVDESTKEAFDLDTFILDKWVPALRSGEYEQGEGELRDWDDKFCCLGVACDIIIKEQLIPGLEWSENDNDSGYSVEGMAGYLSQSVRELTGISTMGHLTAEVPVKYGDEYKVEVLKTSLVNMNDDEHFDFEIIADALESVAKHKPNCGFR